MGAGRGSETLPLPPGPEPFHSSPGWRLCSLLGKLSLNPLRSSDTTDPAHEDAEWTSGEATPVFQPEAPRILPAFWRANPGAHRKSANPADSTNAPKHAPCRGHRAEAGRPPPRGLGHTPRGDVSAGHQKTAWIFPLSDESAFQTVHPRVYFAPV